MKKTLSLLMMLALLGCSEIQEKVPDPLSEKIGSLIIMGFHGKTAQDETVREVKSLIDDKKIAGVILFAHNVESAPQTKDLVSFLSAPQMIVAVDQEGGSVQRLRETNGFFNSPSAQTVGKLTLGQAKDAYVKMAQMIQETGINCVFGPVVDVDYTPTSPVIGGIERSYGKNPHQVALYAKSFVDAMHEKNILTSLKHFPGHGSAQGDSHAGIVDVSKTWKKQELFPYEELFKTMPSTTMVMTAHLILNEVDNTYPSTLSKNTLTGLLRKGLGFKGAIVTDDLHMGAILKNYGLEDTAVLALKAGATFLLFSNNPLAAVGYDKFEIDHQLPIKIIAAIKKRIQGGDRELEACVEQSYALSQKVRSKLK